MKSFLRRLLRLSLTQNILAALAYSYIYLVYCTTRFKQVNREIPEKFWDMGRPAIICFWHNRLLLMNPFWRKGVKAMMLISHHRDGQFISEVTRRFGVGTIHGSSSKSSHSALRSMLTMIGQGYCIGITPDGPRGPRFRAAPGAIYLAKLSGCPLIPVAVATRRRKVLNSWDRFIVNWPFGGGACVWGDPIYIPKNADASAVLEYSEQLGRALRQVSDKADALCGHDPIPLADDADRARIE